jgi:hypothetical protein
MDRSGQAKRLAERGRNHCRTTLDYYELPLIQAKCSAVRLSRRLVLSGPADDFQRSELVRILDERRAFFDVRWDAASLPQEVGAKQ